MKRTGLAAALVRSAAEKGLRDIRENPERGLRNLVDLASMFVSGPNQKAFFEIARQELEKPDSPYFAVFSKLVTETNPDALLELGMSLGYNSLNQGANEIRKVESEQGFNVPWCLNWQMGASVSPDPGQMSEIVKQGLALGIYCHFIYLHPAYPHLHLLPDLVKAHPGCCFVIFSHPGLLNADIFDELVGKAVFIALDLNSDSALLERDLDMLRAGGFLYGGCVTYADGQKHDLEVLSRICVDKGLNLLFMIEETPRLDWGRASETTKFLNHLRANLELPVVPFDLWTDLVAIDHSISSEGCLVMVQQNLDLLLVNADNGEVDTGHNLRESSLAQVLRLALPKGV